MVGLSCFARLALGGEPTEGQKLLEESQQLYRRGDFLKAINLLETERGKGPLEYNYYGGMFSTEEFMAKLYRASNQVDRGVQYFHRLYLDRKKNADLGEIRHIEDILFDLALSNGSFDIAIEVLQNQKKRENYSGWDLAAARIFAAQGKTEAALEKLRSYMQYEHAASPDRVLVHPEFKRLHNNAVFQKMMTQTREAFDAKNEEREKLAGLPEEMSGLKPMSFEELRKALEVYQQVTDAQALNKLREKLHSAEEIILPQVEGFQKEIFNLLKQDKKNTYYRLTLARWLAGLEDAELTKAVAQEVAEDDFLKFPQELFYLTYAVVQSYPREGEQLLKQMLQGTTGGFFLPVHALEVDWDALLIQAFGIVEPEQKGALLKIAGGDDPVASRNAAFILLVFQEPGLIPILAAKINKAGDSEERKKLTAQLAALSLPETATVLKRIKGEAPVDQQTEIQRLIEMIKPPDLSQLHGIDTGIAIEDPRMKEIFLSNLENTYGRDISFVTGTIQKSVNRADIPKLCRIRSSIFYRFSDEAMYDYAAVSEIIRNLRWQNWTPTR